MLTATPLVNNLRDLRWVVRFLERELWLELSLPPDTFVDRDDLEDYREMQRLNPIDSPTPLPNVPGTHPNAVWADNTAPFEDGPAAESFVHGTTKAWAHGMALPLDRIAKLTARSLTQRGISAAEKQDLQRQQLLAGGRAFAILVSLML